MCRYSTAIGNEDTELCVLLEIINDLKTVIQTLPLYSGLVVGIVETKFPS